MPANNNGRNNNGRNANGINGRSLPPVPAAFRLPLHYGALHNMGIDFLVPPGPVADRLKRDTKVLTPALFGGKACVSVNFQLYFAQFDTGWNTTQEIEVNIVAHPMATSSQLPELRYTQYAEGQDQTKMLGNHRLHVVCDSPIAIKTGRELFGEPKTPAWFEAAMPSPNAKPSARWKVVCKAAEPTADGQGIIRKPKTLFTVEADLTGLAAAPVSIAPFTEYGTDASGRALAAPLNVYQPYQRYALPPAAAKKTKVTVSAPASPIGKDLATLLKDATAAGVWTYQSPPVAAQNRPYYVPTKA